ncbi:MAG: DNA repair protein RecO [Bernardetiaceae bacterium]|nr:DNA repair protein RecO [Bernardetiaceae bacterium]
MINKTRGIVLTCTKYGESALISRIYTEGFGLRSYILNGVRKRGRAASRKAALFQPLTQLDLVVFEQANRDIQRISDMQVSYAYQDIPFEPKKMAVALFLTEVLSKVLKEESENQDLYIFLTDSFQFFDLNESGYENFHLQFLIRLSEYLGFGIPSAREFFAQLNLLEVADITLLERMDLLIQSAYSEYVPLNGKSRSLILEWILDFYRLQVDNLGLIRSLDVMKTLF